MLVEPYRIAVIATHLIQSNIENAFSKFSLNCVPSFYAYDPLKGMESVYRQLGSNVDGILVSGIRFADALKDLAARDQRPVVPILMDDAAVHRLLWRLHLERGVQDFSRVYCDFLDHLHLKIEDFLTADQGISISDYMAQPPTQQGLDNFQYAEDLHYQRLLSIWKTGNFDCIITRYSGLIPLLRKEGVQVYYPYHSHAAVRDACESLLREIEIRRLQENQPAEIHFNLEPSVISSNDLFEQRCVLLENTLREFFSDSALNVMPRRSHFGVCLLTDRKSVDWCTQNYTKCIISDYLSKRLDFKVSIGYGIGDNIYHAKLNALNAVREGELLGGSYLVNEKQELIGPLGHSSMLTVPTSSSMLSDNYNDSGLSSLTVMKVLSAIQNMPEGRITARELADKLSVTHRSANHFLSAMEKAGILAVVATRRLTTRGRPERVYGQVKRSAAP